MNSECASFDDSAESALMKQATSTFSVDFIHGRCLSDEP